MFDEDGVTSNIYSSWYETIKRNGTGSKLNPIRSLKNLSKNEINHLIWLLNEELSSRRANKIMNQQMAASNVQPEKDEA